MTASVGVARTTRTPARAKHAPRTHTKKPASRNVQLGHKKNPSLCERRSVKAKAPATKQKQRNILTTKLLPHAAIDPQFSVFIVALKSAAQVARRTRSRRRHEKPTQRPLSSRACERARTNKSGRLPPRSYNRPRRELGKEGEEDAPPARLPHEIPVAQKKEKDRNGGHSS